jgi:hypothetical protein
MFVSSFLTFTSSPSTFSYFGPLQQQFKITKLMKLNKIPINEVTSIINPSIDTLSMCKIRSTASYKSTPNKTQIMRTVAIAPITSYLPYPKVFLSPGDF